MARTLVAGVDSSTQSSTVVLRRLTDGKVVGEARAPHPSTPPEERTGSSLLVECADGRIKTIATAARSGRRNFGRWPLLPALMRLQSSSKKG